MLALVGVLLWVPQLQAPTPPTNVQIWLDGSQPPPPPSGRGPQAAITCPAGAVNITPGQSIQAAVNANAGTATFCLRAGTHPISASITPKSGNTFVGELGAILDGSGWASNDLDDAVFRAVNNGISGVTVRNLVLRNGPSYGVNAYLTAAKWTVDHCEIYGFRNGVSVGIGGVVSNNVIHHNVGVVNDPNPALRGGGYSFNSSRGMLLVNNEIAYNGQEQKFIYGTHGEPNRDLTIANNWVHHNEKDGLWIDGDGAGSVMENNLCEDNGRTGITVEIGASVVVRNNTVRRSGEEGILISASRDTTVTGNTLEDNQFGIGLFLDFGRLAESYPFWTVDLSGNTIANNRVTVSAGQLAALLTFVGTGDRTPYLTNTKKNQFQGDAYSAPSTTGNWFVWNGNKTFAQWQAIPQDATGSLTQR